MRPKIGVVMPLANEAETIHALLQAVVGHLAPHDRLFCVLDRVSVDGTRRCIEAAAAVDSRIVLVWAPENRCVVDAYVRGYREALDAGCEWILEMDGGGSHDPSEIPRFFEAMAAGFDFAAGSRFVAGGRHVGSLKRKLISRGGTLLSNRLLGTRMRDMCSGFECFQRAALEHVLASGIRSRRHFFQTEIRFLLRDWNWIEVPITYRNPSQSVGRASLSEAFRNLGWLYSEKRKALPHDDSHSHRDRHHHDPAADSVCPRAA